MAAETSNGPVADWGHRVGAYRWLWSLALLVFVADQATKAWIGAHVAPESSSEASAIVVIPGWFNLINVGNTGAAWSIFKGQSALLSILAAITLVAIFRWRQALGLRAPLVQICFGLLCGGIAGNLLDRLRFGHVVDFLDFHFGTYIYTTFNLADSGICVGTFIFVIHSLRNPD
jgi:signal peptidase II